MCARSSGSTPGPVSRTHSRAVVPSYADPIAIDVARTGVLDGVLGQLQQRLGEPLLVDPQGR